MPILYASMWVDIATELGGHGPLRLAHSDGPMCASDYNLK